VSFKESKLIYVSLFFVVEALCCEKDILHKDGVFFYGTKTNGQLVFGRSVSSKIFVFLFSEKYIFRGYTLARLKLRYYYATLSYYYE
jgi:hypothetical protein